MGFLKSIEPYDFFIPVRNLSRSNKIRKSFEIGRGSVARMHGRLGHWQSWIQLW